MLQYAADAGNLRRSTRKRRVLVHVDYDSDNSEHEVYRSQTSRVFTTITFTITHL